jgi:hypothetical protein
MSSDLKLAKNLNHDVTSGQRIIALPVHLEPSSDTVSSLPSLWAAPLTLSTPSHLRPTALPRPSANMRLASTITRTRSARLAPAPISATGSSAKSHRKSSGVRFIAIFGSKASRMSFHSWSTPTYWTLQSRSAVFENLRKAYRENRDVLRQDQIWFWMKARAEYKPRTIWDSNWPFLTKDVR